MQTLNCFSLLILSSFLLEEYGIFCFSSVFLGVFIGTREDATSPPTKAQGWVSKLKIAVAIVVLQVRYSKLRLFLLTAFIASWSLKVCLSLGPELHSAFEAFLGFIFDHF